MMVRAVLVVSVVLVLAAGAEASDRRCGTTRFAGKTLDLVAVGKGVTCRRARAIAARPGCEVRSPKRRRVSCFGLRPPGPARVWYRSRSLFPDAKTALVEARRRPCRTASFTPAQWRQAQRHPGGLPSRAQLIADDIVRCKLLHEVRGRDVRRILGPPTERTRRTLEWQIGLQRDSIFQLDAEYLSLTLSRRGIVRAASIA